MGPDHLVNRSIVAQLYRNCSLGEKIPVLAFFLSDPCPSISSKN